MSPPTGEEDEEEEEGKVEEDKQSEAPPGGEVHVEPVAFQEEAGAIVEANDQVSIVYIYLSNYERRFVLFRISNDFPFLLDSRMSFRDVEPL